jgi:ribosome biogenesis GTPase
MVMSRIVDPDAGAVSRAILAAVELVSLGFDAAFARAFEPWEGRPDVVPGRVAIEFNHILRVYVADGEIEATVSGRLRHEARRRGELPAVGDWVAVRRAPGESTGAIVGVLPRRSRFSRRGAGRVTDEQVVAANVDIVFVVMALDDDFSVRRLERYLLLARESGAAPVVLLTKPDKAVDLPSQAAEVATVAGEAPVHVLNPRAGDGLETVQGHLGPGRTGALLGSSGVGKTTIINRLAGGDSRRTQEVRLADSKGRHTTVHRELVRLPDGALIIDTPGMRELQLWSDGDPTPEAFDDILALAGGCHFTDCRHDREPRCAVRAAVGEGRLALDRLEGYLKLQEELAHLTRQQDVHAQLEEKRRSKVMGRAPREHLRTKRRGS